MNRLFSLLVAAFLCCSLQNLNAESATQAVEGESLDSDTKSEIKYPPAFHAELAKMTPEQKKKWDSFSDETKSLVASEFDGASAVTLPCGLSVATLIGEATSCIAGTCTIVQDIFNACCPAGDNFGQCANPFLTALNSLNGVKVPLTSYTLRDIAFQFGFNSKVCAVNARIPHLALLAGGDPNGNVKNCVGTVASTDNAKAWLSACVKGDPITDYSTQCANPRYQALQLGLNWGATPIDCLTSGAYSTNCAAKNCPATWGTSCN